MTYLVISILDKAFPIFNFEPSFTNNIPATTTLSPTQTKICPPRHSGIKSHRLESSLNWRGGFRRGFGFSRCFG